MTQRPLPRLVTYARGHWLSAVTVMFARPVVRTSLTFTTWEFHTLAPSTTACLNSAAPSALYVRVRAACAVPARPVDRAAAVTSTAIVLRRDTGISSQCRVIAPRLYRCSLGAQEESSVNQRRNGPETS